MRRCAKSVVGRSATQDRSWSQRRNYGPQSARLSHTREDNCDLVHHQVRPAVELLAEIGLNAEPSRRKGSTVESGSSLSRFSLRGGRSHSIVRPPGKWSAKAARSDASLAASSWGSSPRHRSRPRGQSRPNDRQLPQSAALERGEVWLLDKRKKEPVNESPLFGLSHSCHRLSRPEDRHSSGRAVHNAPMRFHLRSIGKSPDRRPTMPEQDVAWIAANRRPFSDFTVGSLAPVAFEDYARVLHPAWASPGVPVRWETVAYVGRPPHAFARAMGLPVPAQGRAERPGTLRRAPRHERLATPAAATCRACCSPPIRAPRRPCFVGVWEGYGWAADFEWSASPTLRLDQRTFLVARVPWVWRWRLAGERTVGSAPSRPASSGRRIERGLSLLTRIPWTQHLLSWRIQLVDRGGRRCHPDLEAWRATVDDLVAIGSDEINAG